MKRTALFFMILMTVIFSGCSGYAPAEDRDTGTDRQKEGPVEEARTEAEDAKQEKPEIGLTVNPVLLEKEETEDTGTDAAQPSEEPKELEEAEKEASYSHETKEAKTVQSTSGDTQMDSKTAQPSAEPQDSRKAETSVSQQPVVQPSASEPAPVQESKPAQDPKPEAVPAPVEPETPKSIYDYAFDVAAIRSELVALGQSMGLSHITEDDGVPCTPDTCSWAAPVTASESFQGDRLKRALSDYVVSMPGIVSSYGGPPISSFTIYVQDNGGGSYTFYFLY